MITKIEVVDYTESLGKQTLYLQADKETMAKVLAFIAELNEETNKPI